MLHRPKPPHSTFALQTRQFRSPRPSRFDSEWWQRVVGVGAAGYTLVKLKGLSFALPLLKLTKAGPLLSMLVSMGAYGAIFGLPFGVGMVSLIFIHELGHAAAMRYFNIPVGPMVFIPFMGAVVEMRGKPVSVSHEAFIALAGPLVGTLATAPLMLYGVSTGSQLALSLAQWGCMVNMFNLLPIGQMDGGRVAGALSKWFMPAGLVLSGGLIAINPTNPLLYLVGLSAGYQTYQRFYGDSQFDYYDLSRGEKFAVAGCYAGLLGFITAMMKLNDGLRKSPEELRRER